MFDDKFVQRSLPKKGKKYYKSKQSFNEKSIDRTLQNKVNERVKSAQTYDNLNAKFKLEVELIKKQLEFLFSEQLKNKEIDLYREIKEIMEASLQKTPNRVDAIKKFLFDDLEKEMLLQLCKTSLAEKLKS